MVLSCWVIFFHSFCLSKTSVSYETSSKTHVSKSPKQALRTRLPLQVKRKHPSEHTHHAALPSSFAIPASGFLLSDGALHPRLCLSNVTGQIAKKERSGFLGTLPPRLWVCAGVPDATSTGCIGFRRPGDIHVFEGCDFTIYLRITFSWLPHACSVVFAQRNTDTQRILSSHEQRPPCCLPPSKQHPLTRQSQCDSDIHLYHNSQPHDSLRLPRLFPHPHV